MNRAHDGGAQTQGGGGVEETMTKEKHNCSAEVYREWAHSGICSRQGTKFEDGKWWCYQHAPSVVARKKEEERVKWAEQTAVWKEAARVRDVKDKLYEAYLDGRIAEDIIGP